MNHPIEAILAGILGALIVVPMYYAIQTRKARVKRKRKNDQR